MENIQIIEVKTSIGLEEYVVIDNGNENFTSMLKSYYDEQLAQAEHFTPFVTPAE
jgi:hypothetical protein